MPRLEAIFTDKKAYGWVTALRAAADGLRAEVKWTPLGRELVANGYYKFVSPYWEAEILSPASERPVLRPVKLLSVGLTNEPNLPLPALSNSGGSGPAAIIAMPLKLERSFTKNQTQKTTRKESNMNTNITTKTTEAPAPVTPESGADSPAPGASTEALAPIRDLEARLAACNSQLAALEAEVNSRETRTSETGAELARQVGALASKVTALHEGFNAWLLENAIQAGRITPAEKPSWSASLRENFEAKAAELLQLTPSVHREALTRDLAARNPNLANEAARRDKVQQLVREKMRGGFTYEQAWLMVKREHAEIFNQMVSPS